MSIGVCSSPPQACERTKFGRQPVPARLWLRRNPPLPSKAAAQPGLGGRGEGGGGTPGIALAK